MFFWGCVWCLLAASKLAAAAEEEVSMHANVHVAAPDAPLSPVVVIEKTPAELRAKGGGEFSMLFKHFPAGEMVMSCAHVIQKNPGEFREIERLQIDQQGRLWTKGSLIKFYTFGAEGLAKGERMKYRYALPDGRVLAESSFIPYPLVIDSQKKTFSLEIELLLLEPAMYLLTFNGLQEGERMRLRSSSGAEEIDDDFFYHAANPHVYMPGVSGQTGGYAVLQIVRLAGDSLKVKLPWGMEVLRRVQHALPDAPTLQGPAPKKTPLRR